MLEPMPSRVGVVVRTKDRPLLLSRALLDIAAQNFSSWRVIVVNDGGDPTTVESVVAASGLSERAEVVSLVPGQGRCAAANVGVRACESEYVILHDDDDMWHPDFLDRAVRWLDGHPEAAGVAVATDIVYEEMVDGSWIEVSRSPFWAGMERISLGEMLQVNRIVPISFLYRRDIHRVAGDYDETLDAVEDWDFYLRVLPMWPIGFLAGSPLAFWTQRPSAAGPQANSMFELKAEHARDDAVVRDRALARWINDNGLGMALALAASERRIDNRIAEIESAHAREVADLRREIEANHPVWSRVRRAVRSMRRGHR